MTYKQGRSRKVCICISCLCSRLLCFPHYQRNVLCTYVRRSTDLRVPWSCNPCPSPCSSSAHTVCSYELLSLSSCTLRTLSQTSSFHYQHCQQSAHTQYRLAHAWLRRHRSVVSTYFSPLILFKTTLLLFLLFSFYVYL